MCTANMQNGESNKEMSELSDQRFMSQLYNISVSMLYTKEIRDKAKKLLKLLYEMESSKYYRILKEGST